MTETKYCGIYQVEIHSVGIINGSDLHGEIDSGGILRTKKLCGIYSGDIHCEKPHGKLN